MSSEQAAPWRSQQPGGGPAPPPPPPPPMPGHGTVNRLKSEIPPMRAEPPACVQNAMMTKDKKPFTYTPGGLDLSQIKSPRMARRLTRNANSEGVDGTQIQQQPPMQMQQPPPMQMQQQIPQQIPQPPPPPMQQPPPPPPMVQPPRPQVVLPPPPAVARPAQVGSIYVPPLDSPTITLNKAPTPWLNRTPSQQQDQPPPWVAQQRKQQTPPQTPPQSTPPPTVTSPQPQFKQPTSPQTPQFKPQQSSPQPQFRQPPYQAQGPTTRVVPIQIQMIPVAQSPQPQQQPTTWQPTFQPMPIPTQEGPVTRIIPIQIEGDDSGTAGQSPAFRVLQKMTSRDDPAGEQMRRLQLSEDDRTLMNRLRTQVDEEMFLHNEADPRYRGAAIPSRAFRILQTMTDGDGATMDQQQQMRRQVQQTVAPGGRSVPASEQQQVQEPRKYTGGAIPSRSFQMLQAMVAPDACGPGQSDL